MGCLPSGQLVFLALLSCGQAQGLAWHGWESAMDTGWQIGT